VWISFAVAAVALAVFWATERRVSQPLISLTVLAKRAVAWGNIAGLLAFATETSLVFPLTLCFQDVLGFSPLAAGLAFGVLGVGTVLGGLLAPRFIARTDAKKAIIIGFCVQATATIPLAFVGDDLAWIIPLLALTFFGGVANLVAIVGYVVASTSGLPNEQQGLATGLVTMSQQVGIALGTPIMSAVITNQARRGLLPGIQTAIGVNGALCVAAAVLIAAALRLSPSVPSATETAAEQEGALA
jgi:predicted MFS family arabinose efflux permease